MIVGEFGAVELELILTTLFCLTGYFGNEFMFNTIGSTFELDSSNPIAEYKWNFVLGTILSPIVPIFMYENLGPCLAKKPVETFWLFLPILEVYAIVVLTSYCPVYITSRAWLYILWNSTIGSIGLNLMLTSMTKKKFS